MNEAPRSRRRCDLCLFLLDFCDDLRRIEPRGLRTRTGIQFGPSRPSDLAQLRVRSALTVPNCLHRHNSATGDSRCTGLRAALGSLSGAAPRNARRESLGARPAEELGKRWRFLATYVEVQTSPQLRHLIPRMRDSEC